MQRQNKGTMPAIQRINEKIHPVVQDLLWIKDNSPSVKARNQAGKAILSYEKGEAHAEKAFTLQELKEQQSTEQHTNYQSFGQRSSKTRFQTQES